jgi:hypothetical protein
MSVFGHFFHMVSPTQHFEVFCFVPIRLPLSLLIFVTCFFLFLLFFITLVSSQYIFCLLNAATKGWIFQRLHQKTDFVLISVPFLNLLSKSCRVRRSICGSLVELRKHCFVTQPLQNSLFCRSTVF